MSDSIRIQIINALINQLKNIEIKDGYNFSPEVADDFISLDEVSLDSLPLITLYPDDSNYLPLTNNEYTSGSNDQRDYDGWPISVIGYLKVEDNFITETENFNQDILKSIFSDIHLGIPSIVNNIYLKKIFKPIKVGGNFSKAIVHHVYGIKYDFSIQNP